MAIYSGFTHEKWWFSIVFVNVYQGVTIGSGGTGRTLFSENPIKKSSDLRDFCYVLREIWWYSPEFTSDPMCYMI